MEGVCTKQIKVVEKEKSELPPEEFKEEKLNRAKAWIIKWGIGFTFVIAILWPILTLPVGYIAYNFIIGCIFIQRTKDWLLHIPYVYKDEGKKNSKDKEDKFDTVKCYFVRMESLNPCEQETYILHDKIVHEARCMFMHVHMVSSIAKYMARLSLILSTTVKLQVDLNAVNIVRIEDIYCDGRDPTPSEMHLYVHTHGHDGTSFIGERSRIVHKQKQALAKQLNSRPRQVEVWFQNRRARWEFNKWSVLFPHLGTIFAAKLLSIFLDNVSSCLYMYATTINAYIEF